MKYIFSAILFLSVLTGAHAQDFGKTLEKIDLEQRETKSFQLFTPRNFTDSTLSKNYLGVKFGANLSNFTGDVAGTNGLVGLRIGLVYGRRLSSKTSLQAELAYSKQGAQQDAEQLQTGILFSSGQTISSKYNYLALPITVKHYPFKEHGVYLEGGIRFAYLLKAELQGTGGIYSSTSDDRIDVKSLLNQQDIGLVAGVGYSFFRNVDFSVRYNYNFTDYLDTSESLTADSGTFRNSLWQFSLGFYLDK